MKKSIFAAVVAMLLAAGGASAQTEYAVAGSKAYIKHLTMAWKGERMPDGRPKVSDDLINRLKKVSIEDAWAELMKLGYLNQYEGDWQLVNEDVNACTVGRVVTAQFMPLRPDLEEAIIEQGKKEGRMWQQKRTVSWVIKSLVKGDVYVADTYNKEFLGTAVGSNLGRGVFEATGNGMITNGHVRDIAGLRAIPGFQAWTRGYDPSYMRQTILTNYNVPIRIGKVTVLPGDIVLAKWGAVLFIPPHLVEHIVFTAEFTGIADEFAQEMIPSGKLSAEEIDSVWDERINKMFLDWVDNYKGKLPMSKAELEKYLRQRNF